MTPASFSGLAPDPYSSAFLEHGPSALLVLWLLAIAGPRIPPHLGSLLRAAADVVDPPAKPPAAAA